MVKLSFTVYVPAPLEKVWNYFSNFETVAEWDPNTPYVKLMKETPQKIGSLYDVKTLWKGKVHEFEYKMVEYEKFKKVTFETSNFTTSTVDQITFEEKLPGTNVTYTGDICLRHVFKVITPLIMDDLNKLAQTAEAGFRKRSEEVFGK